MSVTTWEELVNLPNAEFRVLVEPNPSLHMPAGSDWTSEGSNTYSHACEEVEVNAATDDGQEMTKKASLAEVQATAGSWWFDLTNQKIYVHCFDNDDLSSSSEDVVVMVFCWKFWSTGATEFGGHQYRPIVRQDSLPMLDVSVDDIVEGMYKFNFGSFKVNNDGWFDKAIAKYVWTNNRILIKLGGEDLPYNKYCIYFVGRISDCSVGDEEVIFSVKDIRVGTYAQLPIDHYWISNYPKLQTGAEGQAIPIFYGVKENIIPVCVDSNRAMEPYGDPPYPTGSKWKIAGSRKIKEITEIRLNFGDIDYSTPLVENTHYTVDLNNAEFTLLIPLMEGDTLEVDAKGFVADGDVLMKKGATIAKDILKVYLGFIDDDLDLDSFNNTDAVRTQELAIYADIDQSSREIFQTIGRSIAAFFSPTEGGKLSFEAYRAEVPPDVLELEDRDYKADWAVKLDDSFIRNKVKICYDQDPTTQVFKIIERNNYDVLYKFGVRETLILDTYLKIEADAINMADAIRKMCSKPMQVVDVSFGVKGFNLFPTRKVKMSRERAVDSSGKWDKKVFRIKSVVKDTNMEQTKIIGLDDLQSIGEELCEVCYSCQLCVAQEASCTDCYSCQICVSDEGGCALCYSCELCVSDQGGCQVCNTCQLE